MGMDHCQCFRETENISFETELNNNREKEGFIVPKINNFLFSTTDELTNQMGTRQMSILMKVSTHDSNTAKNISLNIIRNTNKLNENSAAEKIQSFFRGYTFRYNFDIEKEKNANLEKPKNSNPDIEINTVDKFKEIIKKSKEDIKIYEIDEINYEKGWQKYIDKKNENEELIKKLKNISKIPKDTSLTVTKGKFGKFNDINCLYRGQINEEKEFHGKGEIYTEENSKYQGIFTKGILEGFGRYINKDKIFYEGIFHNNILIGKATIIKIDEKNNRIKYFGDTLNYLKHGKGIENTKLYRYKGDFENDIKQGNGNILYKDTNEKYEGQFFNNKMHGKGIYIWNNKHKYIGDFCDGLMHGKGKYEWPDGSYYEGEYIKGIKEGYGEYHWSDGSQFEGTFKNGKPDGKGVLTIKGVVKNVQYINGKMLKEDN